MGKKDRYITGEDLGGLRVSVGVEGEIVLGYDRRVMRKALVRGGAEVRKEARRLVSRAAISGAAEVPGIVTGRLKRSIGQVSAGSKGGWVKYGPRTIDGSVFYPAFLFYGSKKTGLKPRANYMALALEARRESVRQIMRAALPGLVTPKP